VLAATAATVAARRPTSTPSAFRRRLGIDMSFLLSEL
jgi:hypothetical protein